MSFTRSISGPKGRIELTLEGLTFVRPRQRAKRQGTAATHRVDWSNIDGATLETSQRGRPIVRVLVSGTAVEHHRDDPHAVKLSHKQADEAQQFVDRVNEEVDTRRRWRRLARGSPRP